MNLLCLAAGDPPLGDGRPAAAGRDDDVALAGDGRQSHDAVQAQESDASRVQIASWQQQGEKKIIKQCTHKRY